MPSPETEKDYVNYAVEYLEKCNRMYPIVLATCYIPLVPPNLRYLYVLSLISGQFTSVRLLIFEEKTILLRLLLFIYFNNPVLSLLTRASRLKYFLWKKLFYAENFQRP